MGAWTHTATHTAGEPGLPVVVAHVLVLLAAEVASVALVPGAREPMPVLITHPLAAIVVVVAAAAATLDLATAVESESPIDIDQASQRPTGRRSRDRVVFRSRDGDWTQPAVVHTNDRRLAVCVDVDVLDRVAHVPNRGSVGARSRGSRQSIGGSADTERQGVVVEGRPRKVQSATGRLQLV